MNCRYCKNRDTLQTGQKMLKYAARHWAHYRCWLRVKGAEIPVPLRKSRKALLDLLVTNLYGCQLAEFPVMGLADWMEDFGVPGRAVTLLEQAIQIVREEEAA